MNANKAEVLGRLVEYIVDEQFQRTHIQALLDFAQIMRRKYREGGQ